MKKSFVLLIFLLFSCNEDSIDLPQIEIGTDSGKIKVYVASDDASRARGLMEVTEIDADGMIFAYNADQKMSFWMKNTVMPLSIAFISSSGEVKEIYDMTPQSLQSVPSKHSVRYALEVPKGDFAKFGIDVGDTLSIPSIQNIK